MRDFSTFFRSLILQSGFLQVGDFPEHYHLLVLKSLSFLAWARQSCPSAKVLVKTDDDVVFDLENMSTENLEEKSIYCSILQGRPARLGRPPKYFIPEAEYDKEVLPDYCSGVFYYMSKKVMSPCQYHYHLKRAAVIMMQAGMELLASYEDSDRR